MLDRSNPHDSVALVFWISVFLFGQLTSGEEGKRKYKRLRAYRTKSGCCLLPHPWVFGVVWTILNVTLGIAAWQSLQNTEHYANRHHYRATVSLWLIYLFTLKLWNPAFDSDWRYSGPIFVCFGALVLCAATTILVLSRYFYVSSGFDIIWCTIVLALALIWHIYAFFLSWAICSLSEDEEKVVNGSVRQSLINALDNIVSHHKEKATQFMEQVSQQQSASEQQRIVAEFVAGDAFRPPDSAFASLGYVEPEPPLTRRKKTKKVRAYDE